MAQYEIGVYGASDDLIEIIGDIREEFYANYNEPTHIMVGNTELVVEYDGEWHISVVDLGENDTTAHYSVGRKQLVEKANGYTEGLVVNTAVNEVSKID